MSKKDLQKAASSYAKRQHLLHIPSVEKDDAHTPIKGFTLLPGIQDYNYSAGHVRDLDVSVVVRSFALPNEKTVVTKLILQFHLPMEFAHIIALGSSHEEERIKGLLAAFHHYRRADTGRWKVFTSAQTLHHVDTIDWLLNELVDLGVSDVEFEGPYLRVFLDTVKNDADLDKIEEYVYDLNLKYKNN